MSETQKLPPSIKSVEAIPLDLREARRWVLWRFAERGGKRTKVPLSPDGSRPADATNPANWLGFDDALRGASERGTDGIGFALGAGWLGADVDHGVNPDGSLEADVREIVDALDSYSERSVSGRGVHVLVRGALPPGGRRKGTVEMYDGGRFFVVTGDHIEGTPDRVEERTEALAAFHRRVFGAPTPDRALLDDFTPARGEIPADDDELLRRARGAKNGPKFSALFDTGNWEALGYGSQSEADAALLSMLGFWTGNDAARMERIFSRSALGRREKWTERADYRSRSIAAAIAACSETYSGAPAAPLPLGRHGIEVRILSARRTDARCSVRLALSIDGRDAGTAEGTTTERGIEQMARAVADAVQEVRGERPALAKLKVWLRFSVLREDLLRAAEARGAAEPEEETGRNMIEVASAFMREEYGFTFADPDGSLWSEVLGRPVTCNEFSRLGGRKLVKRLEEEAAHFPQPDRKSPTRGLSAAEKALRFAWGDLLRALPDEVGATLAAGSRAGARLRRQIVEALDSHGYRIGTISGSFGPAHWESSTLAGCIRAEVRRAVDALAESRKKGTSGACLPGWQRCHDGFDGWFKLSFREDGGLALSIAVRAPLLQQTRVNRPPRTAEDFVTLAERYGLLDPTAPRARVTVDSRDDRDSRLTVFVLAPDLVDELTGFADRPPPEA